MGIARSKWGRGGLHQPPLSLGWAKLGGQKLVAVTKMDGLPGLHHLGSSAHLISKQAPQLNPLLNNAVLSAAVFTPYPWLYRLPYPHAPPEHKHTRVIKQPKSIEQHFTCLVYCKPRWHFFSTHDPLLFYFFQRSELLEWQEEEIKEIGMKGYP